MAADHPSSERNFRIVTRDGNTILDGKVEERDGEYQTKCVIHAEANNRYQLLDALRAAVAIMESESAK